MVSTDGGLFFLQNIRKHNLMQTLLVVVLLLASSCQAMKQFLEKVYVKPDQKPGYSFLCSVNIVVDNPDKEYELSVETNDCDTCSDKQKFCGRERPISCRILFKPKSDFIRSAMKICADTKDASISMCRQTISMGTIASRLDCDRRPRNEKHCSDISERLHVTYSGFNYCMFKGPYRIYTEPDYYQLTYDCPHGNRRRVKERVISFGFHQLYERDKLCLVYLRPPGAFTIEGVCIQFELADFSKNGPTLSFSLSSLTWHFNSRNPPVLNHLYCDDEETSGFSVSLRDSWIYQDVLKRFEHRVIFTYEFREKRIFTSINDDQDKNSEYEEDDSDEGLRPEYIALGVIGFLFFAGCCYCCIRCQMSNNYEAEAENTAGYDENEPFQENGDTLSVRYRPNMDTPVVHDIVRGTIPALNSQNAPQTSRSASPLHVPSLYEGSNILSPVYPQEELETSPQLQPSAPPQLQDSASSSSVAAATAPPPSYDSLFPTQADNA